MKSRRWTQNQEGDQGGVETGGQELLQMAGQLQADRWRP